MHDFSDYTPQTASPTAQTTNTPPATTQISTTTRNTWTPPASLPGSDTPTTKSSTDKAGGSTTESKIGMYIKFT